MLQNPSKLTFPVAGKINKTRYFQYSLENDIELVQIKIPQLPAYLVDYVGACSKSAIFRTIITAY